jgi:mRNA-binding protein PUF3
MIPQFGSMGFGQNGHASALRKASEPWNGQNVQRPLQYPSKFGSLSFNNHKDDIDENDPHGVSYITSDDSAATQSNDYSRFSSIRFGQAPAPIDYLHGSTFANGGASPRSLDFANPMKFQTDWTSYAEDIALGKELSGMSEQQAILDPRLQHMIRVQYQPTMYNPYALSNGIHSNGSGPYLQMYGIGGLDNTMPPRETLVSDGVQSTKLYDFKNAGKNNKRWELSDIFDHIAEFAGDQYGSRFIQTKLETANSDEKERVFREIEPNSIPLMTDVFGNYVIQKFFDHGHQEHKKLLANKMRGQVLTLSLQMYGCRVVQKALEHILVEQQAALVGELENHVLKCVKDQNGNHVIQKAIERCAPETIGFIYKAFLDQVQHLSLHPYGCRVIQRCLERPEWFPAKPRIMHELHASMQQGMIADQYGNYVVQHVVQKGEPKDKVQVFRLVIAGLEGYSKHKFASNVVEKCIEYSDDNWRREVVNVLTAADQRRSEGDTTLVSMIKDNFGNYVIRESTILSTDAAHADLYC